MVFHFSPAILHATAVCIIRGILCHNKKHASYVIISQSFMLRHVVYHDYCDIAIKYPVFHHQRMFSISIIPLKLNDFPKINQSQSDKYNISYSICHHVNALISTLIMSKLCLHNSKPLTNALS